MTGPGIEIPAGKRQYRKKSEKAPRLLPGAGLGFDGSNNPAKHAQRSLVASRRPGSGWRCFELRVCTWTSGIGQRTARVAGRCGSRVAAAVVVALHEAEDRVCVGGAPRVAGELDRGGEPLVELEVRATLTWLSRSGSSSCPRWRGIRFLQGAGFPRGKVTSAPR